MGLRIAVSVSNDLSTDQRVRKQCFSMHQAGHGVLLIGRKLPDSLPIDRPYKVRRLNLLFRKKAFFYAELNMRLFFRLLFAKVDLLYANDLDTLPANALVATLRKLPLVYDSHEFFTEVPEIQHRPLIKRVWQWLERKSIQRASLVITVNESIAGLLKEAYGLDEVLAVRNVPEALNDLAKATREELSLPEARSLLILQGSGINMHRGAEELLEALALIDRSEQLLLLVIGSGDALPVLRDRAMHSDLFDKIMFKPRMPYREMMQYTAHASLGLSLDKDTNINYRYSLPNKVFDYIAAGIPILASDLVEVRRLVEQYDVGVITESHDPATLASLIKATLRDRAALEKYRNNAMKAAQKLHWEEEFAPVLRTLEELVYKS